MKRNTVNENALQRFHTHLILEERSAATIEKYCRDVKAFGRFLDGAEINKEAAIAYKEHLQAQGYAVRSINSMLASINSFFVFLGIGELRVKTIRMQQQLFCPAEKELSRAEYERLVHAAQAQNNVRLVLLLQTICGSGIRVSELPFITVEAARQGEAVVSCKGKTRSVFLVRALQKKLLRYAASQGIRSGCIFLNRNGKPMDRITVWREMKRICKAAGVEESKVFPHNLRHLFARIFYDLDKDIVKLADVLGHSSINTTRIYVVSSGHEHQKRMEQMRLVK